MTYGGYTDAVRESFERMKQLFALPSGELNKDAHCTASLMYFKTHMPDAYALFIAEAEERYWKSMHRAWIRNHHGPVTGNSVVDDMRDMVNLPLLPGIPCVYRSKMKRRHVQSHVDYHRQSIRPHKREIEWGEDVLARMDAVNLLQDDDDINAVLTDEERAAWG
jgi:hypothetical protein